MSENEFKTNANLVSLLAKVRTLKLALSDDQKKIYNDNIDAVTQDQISKIKDHLPEDLFHQFDGLVKAMVDKD